AGNNNASSDDTAAASKNSLDYRARVLSQVEQLSAAQTAAMNAAASQFQPVGAGLKAGSQTEAERATAIQAQAQQASAAQAQVDARVKALQAASYDTAGMPDYVRYQVEMSRRNAEAIGARMDRQYQVSREMLDRMNKR